MNDAEVRRLLLNLLVTGQPIDVRPTRTLQRKELLCILYRWKDRQTIDQAHLRFARLFDVQADNFQRYTFADEIFIWFGGLQVVLGRG